MTGSYARFEHYSTTLEVETCLEFWPPSPVSAPLCGRLTLNVFVRNFCTNAHSFSAHETIVHIGPKFVQIFAVFRPHSYEKKSCAPKKMSAPVLKLSINIECVWLSHATARRCGALNETQLGTGRGLSGPRAPPRPARRSGAQSENTDSGRGILHIRDLLFWLRL